MGRTDLRWYTRVGSIWGGRSGGLRSAGEEGAGAAGGDGRTVRERGARGPDRPRHPLLRSGHHRRAGRSGRHARVDRSRGSRALRGARRVPRARKAVERHGALRAAARRERDALVPRHPRACAGGGSKGHAKGGLRDQRAPSSRPLGGRVRRIRGTRRVGARTVSGRIRGPRRLPDGARGVPSARTGGKCGRRGAADLRAGERVSAGGERRRHPSYGASRHASTRYGRDGLERLHRSERP